MAMEFRTVGHRASVLSETLDRALEAFSLGDTYHVNAVAVLKNVCLDLLRQLKLGAVF